MPQFQYTALNPTGQRVAGVLAGTSEQAVLVELESRQLVPVSIAQARERASLRRVSARRLAASYVQLADLLRAGVPLLRGLRLLGGRRSNPRLAGVFRELGEAVAEGTDLADAMARHPDVFPKVHIAMVRAGERGGFLEGVMVRLGQFVSAQAELRSKVIGNLIYPAMLGVFGVAVLIVIFGVFVPKFEPLFAHMRGGLPLVSRAVFGASALVTSYAPVALAVVAAATVGGWRLLKRPGAARFVSERTTHAPVIGPLVRALAAARFCRMLGTMLANGIPMLTAMQIAREAAGNLLMEEAIERATESVRAGEPLAGPLAQSGLFGEDVIEMISVAESANNLEGVLITIADTIDTRVDRMLTAAVRLIEPLLLVLLAGVIVVVAAGLILPMTQFKADF